MRMQISVDQKSVGDQVESLGQQWRAGLVYVCVCV